MNKFCSLSIQRVCSFSKSREKSKRSLTARLCWFPVPQPSIIYWRVQNSFQTTMPCSLTWNSRWEQGLLVFSLLPTHWQVVFKALCSVHKCLYRAGQRWLSKRVPAAPWAAFHSPGCCLPHLLFSPQLLTTRAKRRGRKWAQRRKEGSEKRLRVKGIVKRGRGWNYY